MISPPHIYTMDSVSSTDSSLGFFQSRVTHTHTIVSGGEDYIRDAAYQCGTEEI
jgi:hypothetical protein